MFQSGNVMVKKYLERRISDSDKRFNFDRMRCYVCRVASKNLMQSFSIENLIRTVALSTSSDFDCCKNRFWDSLKSALQYFHWRIWKPSSIRILGWKNDIFICRAEKLKVLLTAPPVQSRKEKRPISKPELLLFLREPLTGYLTVSWFRCWTGAGELGS